MTEDWQNGGFGIYVHWPFCTSKCPYCDFNSHVSASVDQTEWLEAYEKEIARYASVTPGRVVNSVFFGGGTPSLMEVGTVAGVIDAIARHWTLSNHVEITLEANPGSVEATRFRGYRSAGVDRVSMGIQALNDPDLKRLGRLHSVAEALAAFDIARDTFDRVSFDLIYARQDQTLNAWEAELRTALRMAVDHLSLYQLTIEHGTAFGDRYSKGRLRGLPDDDLSADMYQLTQDICSDHEMPAYEVSNHSRSGAESRHNLIYWRYGDYAGIGPGAHGRLTLGGTKVSLACHANPAKWLAAVSGGNGEKGRSVLTPYDQSIEYLLMSLRLQEGTDRPRFRRFTGVDFDQDTLSHLEELGLILVSAERIRATEQGRMVLNAILAELAPTA